MTLLSLVSHPSRRVISGSRYRGASKIAGFARKGLSNAIDHVFSTQQLHRVMANYRPDNLRSARLLERLGFENEGLARAYLKIDGA
ncbi:GNAT family N-acetyltransferase [Paraburkholderia sp. MM5384-R2]|uniref:GNAT family N-acetyltransferase n=1 Tax=Paraburkholderia sp. MM5384-R2 TaxID=2723097 RepID=UPI0021A2EB3C|nr:GNAT family N-acetyltransferase [Paraburkholderia sp. MM5384-R2]